MTYTHTKKIRVKNLLLKICSSTRKSGFTHRIVLLRLISVAKKKTPKFQVKTEKKSPKS